MKPGKVSASFDIAGGGIVVFREVSATVCEQCGERHFDSAIVGWMLAQAKKAEAAGDEVRVQRYVAA